MNFPKFKLVNSLTKEVIGYEYLTIDGWKNDVFDFGEREGTLDQRELGDGFLGIVQRLQFVGLFDQNKAEVYEGDVCDDDDSLSVRWSKETGCFEFYFLFDGESALSELNWYDAFGHFNERTVSSNIFISSLS